MRSLSRSFATRARCASASAWLVLGAAGAVAGPPQVIHEPTSGGDTEFIVSADLLDGSARADDPHCALAISANHINGQFVAVVLKLAPGAGDPGMSIRISPGTVDWRYGIESYLEPDAAWLELGTVSTKTLGEVTSAPYATVHERRIGGSDAGRIYEAALAEAFTVRVDAAGMENRYPLGHAFADEVVNRARACVVRLGEG